MPSFGRQTPPGYLQLFLKNPLSYRPHLAGPLEARRGWTRLIHTGLMLMVALKRGRQASARSVQRYDLHARVLRQLERLTPSLRRLAATSHSAFGAALLNALACTALDYLAIAL